MTNEETFALIDKLRASGVRSYRDGDLVIEFDRVPPGGRRVTEDSTLLIESRLRGEI